MGRPQHNPAMGPGERHSAKPGPALRFMFMGLMAFMGFMAFWIGAPQRAHAADPDLSLDWRAPAECPQRRVLLERLGELLPELGEVGAARAPAKLVVQARVANEGARWVVDLRFVSALGVNARRFSAGDCRALSDATALVIAVNLDPLATSEGIAAPIVAVSAAATAPAVTATASPPMATQTSANGPQGAQTVPRTEAGPTEGPPRPVERSDDPEGPEDTDSSRLSLSMVSGERRDAGSPRPPVRGALAILGGGGLGPMGLSQLAVALDAGVLGRRWRAGLRATYYTPRTEAISGGDGAVARYDGLTLGARGCGVPSAGRVEFPLCLGFAAGSLRGEGIGPTPGARRAWLPWVAVVPGVGLRAVISPNVALSLDLDLSVSLVRGRYALDALIVRDIAPVSLRALVGIELRLPTRGARENRENQENRRTRHEDPSPRP